MRYLWLVALAVPHALLAQTDTRIRARDEADFLAKAKAAAAAYVIQEDALLDGYRPIGPELPAMGQHWLNPEFANLGYVDPARPGFLLYVTIDGKPTLAGMGYTMALKPGEQPPLLPAGKTAWHEHAGSVADEAFRVTHHTVDDDSRFRVVALHIWHALPAPDGLYSVENWSLPFVRAGRAVPRVNDQRAARVLALTGQGHRYYSEVIRRHLALDDASSAGVGRVLERYAQRASRSSDVEELANLYDQMWSELFEKLPSAAQKKARRLKEDWQNAHH